MHQDIETTFILEESSRRNRGSSPIMALFACWAAVSAIAQEKPVSDYKVPTEVAVCMKMLGPGYRISDKINPFYLRGSFHGQVGLGYAVLIQREHKQGVMFCRARAAPEVLGAGTEFHKMMDLNFTGWQVHPKTVRVERGVGEGAPPVLRGDAILIEWEESASAILYWNGKRFVWYQQGD